MKTSFAAALAILILVAGCSKRETGVEQATRDNVILIGNGGDPPDLDPHLAAGSPENAIVQALFGGLVRVDPSDLHPVPGVAQSWDLSADGKVYTFHIRADAKWSDGTAVAADDFYHSFERLLAPAFASDNADQLYYVAGAEDFHLGRQADFSRVGFRVIDPLTLEITLTHPTPFFPQILSERFTFPVPISVLNKFGGALRRGSAWTRPENIVGNGPFILKAWKPNQFVEVSRSPTYWDRGRVKLQAVRFYSIEEQAAEERLRCPTNRGASRSIKRPRQSCWTTCPLSRSAFIPSPT